MRYQRTPLGGSRGHRTVSACGAGTGQPQCGQRPCLPPPLRPFHLISRPASSQRPEASSALCLAVSPAPTLPPTPAHPPPLCLSPHPESHLMTELFVPQRCQQLPFTSPAEPVLRPGPCCRASRKLRSSTGPGRPWGEPRVGIALGPRKHHWMRPSRLC